MEGEGSSSSALACRPCSEPQGLQWFHAFQSLVAILGEADQLRKYAVWNSVAVVKILKKRRKQTNLGMADSATERAGWLSKQVFYSGNEFAELHAAIESLGHALVLSELAPGGQRGASPAIQVPQKCPICLDEISDVVELDCGHKFCWKCFVLGPIAFQPGEYRITLCPICRKETGGCKPLEINDITGDEDEQLPRPEDPRGRASFQGVLSRFLHTYFPEQAALPDAPFSEGRPRSDTFGVNDGEVRDIVGDLVKVVLADNSWKSKGSSAGQAGQGESASSSSAGPRDFFETLPSRPETNQMQAVQKLQWLQLASSDDPLALDESTCCSLCTEPLLFEAVVTTPCKHHFHKVCIKRVEMPRCPLCSSDLPFSWFLPADHPMAECGFRCVPAKEYKPQFPGGPSRGSGGYPLHRPPPTSLYGPGGLMMKSYLHRIPPMGGEDDEGDREADGGHSPGGDSSDEQGSSASESSSEESNSEDGLATAERRERDPASKNQAWVYSALGRMKLCQVRDGAARAAQAVAEAALPREAPEDESAKGGPVVLLIGNHL